MTVCFFGNGEVGVEVLSFLIHKREKIGVVVLHQKENSRNYKELINLAKKNGALVIHDSDLLDDSCVLLLKSMGLAIGVSAFFNHIIRPEVIDIFGKGIINLHTSFLPWNRGSNPNVWSIIKNDPVGVSIHIIDEGVDTGPIIAQKTVEVPMHFTAKDLYSALQESVVQLFKDTWPKVKSENYTLIDQHHVTGTVNFRKDLAQLKSLDLNESMTIKETLNILRACMFPPYQTAYFEIEGTRYNVEINITKIDEGN